MSAIRFLCKSRQAPVSDNNSCGKQLCPFLYLARVFDSSAFPDFKDILLQPLQKPPRVRAVHLGMVELERQLQRRSEKPLTIFAPDDKRIVENAAVHAHGAVYFGIHNGGCAYDHAFGQIVIFAAFGCLARQAQVVGVEPRKIG